MEQTTLEGQMCVIPAPKTTPPAGPRRGGRQRVAAYCRVSTNSEEQLNRYAAQKNYYTQKIEEIPIGRWSTLFADEGITGTSMKKRAEFSRMIAACKRGRIDMSLNIIPGIQQSVKAGNIPFQYSRTLGYRRGPDGKPEIDPELPETVRLIYTRYLEGRSLREIQKELTERKIPHLLFRIEIWKGICYHGNDKK